MTVRCHVPSYFITGGQTGADSIPLRVVSTVANNNKHISGVRGYLPAGCKRSDGQGYEIKKKFGLWEGAAVSNRYEWRDKANAGMADACVCFLSTKPKTGRGTLRTANIFINGQYEMVMVKKPDTMDWLVIGTAVAKEQDEAKVDDWRYLIAKSQEEETVEKQKAVALEGEAKQLSKRTLGENGTKPGGFSFSYENPKYPIMPLAEPDPLSPKTSKLQFTRRPVLVFWDVEVPRENDDTTSRLAEVLREFLDFYEPENLMFSGAKEETCPGIEERGAAVVVEALWGES